MKKNVYMAILTSALFTPFANSAVDLKWTESVGEVIKPTRVTQDGLEEFGYEGFNLTYEMKKPCKYLMIFATSISNDGVELGKASFQHARVSIGDKFRDPFTLIVDGKYHILLDNITCLKP
ncbi:hypothetical protein HHX48_17670 [Salinimonas sp. HHU 13199]|uniref:Uncharacterized protein n=1 Tax=Salinimonas profundi TaxID=2729140 RepID=A0ABR8LTS9_9ALTE|nr:hypothetical protein [Salinimonas profundi]MBD3587570.1 hypothetical protein [Salinimonas profundi]